MLNSQAQKTLYGLMDMIYPVGSYYITESSDLNTEAKMATKFGGTWAQLDAGRFLEAVTSGAGSNKSAGLPNITGYFTGTLNGNNGGNGVHSGACYLYNVNSDSNNWGGNSGWNNTSTEGFDASRSNSIYGNSTTVQPKSRTVYIYRRTALAGGGIELVISLLNSILEGGRKYVKR